MRPAFAVRIFALCQEFDDAGYSRRLATIADFVKPIFSAIHKDMEEGPFKKDVMREPNGVSWAYMLKDAVRYQIIDRRCAKTNIGQADVAKHWFVDQSGPWSTAEEEAYRAMHKELKPEGSED